MSGLARRCACGAENALDARCCDRCGAPLSGAEGFSSGGAVVAARPLASADVSARGGAAVPSDVAACGRAAVPSDVAACGSAAVPAPAAARAVFVGRGADCALRLASDTVSERHAVVFESGGVLFVQDLGSRNGTFLDGARVTRAVPWNGAATLRCGGGAV
ncbi:FHA domain-containing protein, partial [bacterium]|nr:FHA domain-containing protein [bacterium]